MISHHALWRSQHLPLNKSRKTPPPPADANLSNAQQPALDSPQKHAQFGVCRVVGQLEHMLGQGFRRASSPCAAQ